MLEKTLFAEVVPAWEEDDRLAVRGQHQLQAYAANVGLYLAADLIAQLLLLLGVAVTRGVADLLDEVGRVVFHPLLHVQLPPNLLLLPLLVPHLPLLPMLLL